MAKTRRMMQESLPDVDAVIEIRDARIPYSSKNPEIDRLTVGKPRLVLLNKSSLCDTSLLPSFLAATRKAGIDCLATDCVTGKGLNEITPAIQQLCAEKLERYKAKGMVRDLKAMVIGIPNVGKSSLINRLAGSGKTKVENRPGVTRDKQWVPTRTGLVLLDMPGVLWPKFDDAKTAENLALTGAIKDDILDTETLAITLLQKLRLLYPTLLCARFKLSEDLLSEDTTDLAFFEQIGRNRGMIVRGGEISYERCAAMLLEEFRSGKIGNITLDR